MGSVTQLVKNLIAVQKTRVQSLVWEDPLEKGMATHSGILTWRNPGTEDPGSEGRRPQFMGSHRVGHDWATNTFTLVHTPIFETIDIFQITSFFNLQDFKVKIPKKCSKVLVQSFCKCFIKWKKTFGSVFFSLTHVINQVNLQSQKFSICLTFPTVHQ